MRVFETGATRDTDETKPDYEGFLSPAVIESFGRYMTAHRVQADGKLRDSDNWQKGIPRDAYMKSLIRHVLDLWKLHRGLGAGAVNIEEACNAILFNVQGYQHEYLKADQRERLLQSAPKEFLEPAAEAVRQRIDSAGTWRLKGKPKVGRGCSVDGSICYKPECVEKCQSKGPVYTDTFGARPCRYARRGGEEFDRNCKYCREENSL